MWEISTFKYVVTSVWACVCSIYIYNRILRVLTIQAIRLRANVIYF